MRLVSAEWVAAQPNILRLEAGYERRNAYRAGHLPGAVYLDTNLLEAPPLWKRVSDAELARVLPSLGVSFDTPVVLYSSDTTAAARGAVILHYAGVERIYLLDGGIAAWERAGFPLEIGEIPPVPVSAFGRSIPHCPEVFADREAVARTLQERNGVVVCVRSWEEHIGASSGYDYIEPRGRIAGSVWGDAGTLDDRMRQYRNPDGTAKSLPEIAAHWRRLGVTNETGRVLFYCGTAWRASEAFCYARLLGWRNSAVYDGGWLEWSADPTNPIATGAPSGKSAR